MLLVVINIPISGTYSFTAVFGFPSSSAMVYTTLPALCNQDESGLIPSSPLAVVENVVIDVCGLLTS